MVHELTRGQARRIIVRSQLLEDERPGDVVEVAEQVARIKIDPTAVIAPCEQLSLWSRIGPGYEPGDLRKAVEDDRTLFEFDGAFWPASMLPLLRPGMAQWPRRRDMREWLAANDHFRRDVIDRLRADGPLRADQIPDTARVAQDGADGWYGPGQVPRMLEALARQGVVAVTARQGRTRVWDLAERVHPATDVVLEAQEAEGMLRRRRLRAAGLAKQDAPWSDVGQEGEPARVEGSRWRWRVDPDVLAGLDEDVPGRVAILNPYDAMLFDRPRLKEVFDFPFVLEQFKPKAQRRYGYFAHPILIGDRFMGLLDASVDTRRDELRVDAIHELEPFEPEEHEMLVAELEALADWLGIPLGGIG